MKSLFISLLALIPLFGFGQKVSLAPEIGLNIIPMENTEIGHNFHLGYHVGGHFKYHFSKKIKLSSGVFLTQKKKNYTSSSTGSVFTLFDDLLNGFGGLGGGLPGGADSSSSDLLGLDSLNIPGLNTEYTETIRGVSSELFIEIPLLANYKFKNVNFYLGPYAAVLIGAKRKEELTTDIPIMDVIDVDLLLEQSGLGDFGGVISNFIPKSGVESSEISGTTGLRKIDTGINAGVGYEMNNVHFNFMYSHGLLDFRDENEGKAPRRLKLFRVSIAYFFDLGKQSSDNSSSFN
jgi:hypothetical protein